MKRDAFGPGAGTVVAVELLDPVVPGDVDDEVAELYRREHDQQVRRAFLLIGDSATAHDVVADAFVAVLRRWDRIDDHGPYLSRCVLNRCRDVHRARPREELRPDPAAGLVVEVADPGLADLVLGLPFRQRAVVVLRYYGGLTNVEIAEQLDCPPGTVGSLLHRALAALRTRLDQEEPS